MYNFSRLYIVILMKNCHYPIKRDVPAKKTLADTTILV